MSRRNRAVAGFAAFACALPLIITTTTAIADPAVAVPAIASINVTPVPGGDVTTSATFSWHTAGTATTAPQTGLAIGLADDFNCAAATLATSRQAPTPTVYSSVAYYHVAVTGLEAGEEYAYCVISSKGDRSPTYYYETPNSGDSFNFLAFGNPYWKSTTSYVNTFRQTAESALDNFPEAAFLAIAGAYGSSSDLSHWDGLVSQHAQSVLASNMIVPSAHADGSSNRYYALGTGLPLASGSAYVTDNYAAYHDGALFLSINTYRTATADINATLSWIDAQVAAVPDGTWIIAEIPTEFWGGHTTVINAAIRTALHAKFRQIGVALVLQGRTAAYTRSWPIGDGTTPDILRNTGGDQHDSFNVEDGVIYITPGASSIEQENPSSGTYSAASGWLAAYTSYGSSAVKNLAEYKTYSVVDVDDALDVYAMTADGAMVDHFTINRGLVEPRIFKAPSSVTVASPANSSATVALESNIAWTVYSKPTWATVTPTSGSGNAALTVTATSANTSTVADRTGTIVLRSATSSSVEIQVTVTQSKATVWYATPTSLSFTAAGNALVTTVYSNGPWTLKSKPDWVTSSRDSYTTTAGVTLTAAANNTTGVRSGQVVFARDGQPDVTVSVSQAWVAPWSLSATRADVGYRAGSAASVTLSTGVTWKVSTKPTWVDVNPSSGTVTSGVSYPELTITANQQNPSTATRSGVVYLTATGKATLAITVYQQASPYWYATPTSLNFTAAGNALVTTIYSNGAWTLKSKPDWISASRDSYTTTAGVTLTAAVNTTTGVRSGTVVFAREGLDDVVVNVSQAWVAPWTLSATRADISYAVGSQSSVTLTTGVTWNVLSKPAWVSVSPSSGTVTSGVTTETLTITAAEKNNAQTTRSGLIYLTAPGSGKANLAITVYQAGSPLWYTNPTSLSYSSAGGTSSLTVYSNASWTLSKPDWLTASRTSYTTTAAVTFTAGANTSTETRTGSVTFTRAGEPDIVVPVTQTGLQAATFTPFGINNGFSTDPQTARVFTWLIKRTAGITGATLTYAPAGQSLTGPAAATVTSTWAQVTDTMSAYHLVTSTIPAGTLQPGTTYQYQIKATTSTQVLTSDVYQFKTAGSASETFKFVAVADSQGSLGSYKTIWADTITKALERNPDAAFVTHAGDITNDTTTAEVEEWTTANGSLLATPAFNPVLGNHDDRANSDGRMWNAIFPRGSDGFTMEYSYVYGNAVFIHLNLNHYSTSSLNTHGQYVQRVANQYRTNPATGKERFIIIVEHKSPYGGAHAGNSVSGGDYGAPAIRSTLRPYFEAAGVDLVLAGHDHQYIRSCPVMNGVWNCNQTDINTINSNTEGIVYLIPRNSGGKTYAFVSRVWNQVPINLGSSTTTKLGESMYSTVTVTTNEIQVNSYYANSTIPVDSFTIVQ
ncbi:MAG: metallophosphoesterase [Propionibacteriaceae bacterium]|jgi:predicted phosphodiesterase|nr:metallophosphoesterase [Propionibacteriaceae bacterium]